MAESVAAKGDFDAQELSSAGGGAPQSRPKRRYSNDDIDVHYTSLTHVQFATPVEGGQVGGAMALTPTDPPRSAGLLALTPTEATTEGGAVALTPTDSWHSGAAGAGLTPPRRQSAASVQTEVPLRSPKPPGSRRRSETANHDGRRRKSRANGDTIVELDPSALQDPAAANGVRRATRSSQLISPYDLDGKRTSVSSSGHRRKTSRHSEVQEDDMDERRRHKVVFVCASVAVTIFLLAILLVAITLRMSPAIDEMVRKENEDILIRLQGPSHDLNTTVPPTDAGFDPTQS